MSCYGGPFKSGTLDEIGTIERKWVNLTKATDFNGDFAVTSARFSKIIELIFVVPGLTFDSIKKPVTEMNENKFQTFNLENCAYFEFLVWETTLIKFKSSFSPQACNNLPIIDRIIEDTRFLFAFINFSPNYEPKKYQTFTFLRPRFKIRACSGDSWDSGYCLSKIIVATKENNAKKTPRTSGFRSQIRDQPSTPSFYSLKETQASAIRDFHDPHLSLKLQLE